jgi:hypothetical protein
VEIHTRIMPWFWRLPEREMLSHSRAAPNYECLSTLDTEGMMLHALMHCAAHLFGCGLKAAWDVAWLLEREPLLDADRVSSWADRCAMPAGFYLPANVIRDSLDVAIPSQLVERVPKAPRFGPLERVVRLRLFLAMEGAYELNPFTTHGIFLMLHGSWRGRALHVASLLAPHERESRAQAAASSKTRRLLSAQLRESSGSWKSYRRLAKAGSEAITRQRVSQLLDE